MDWYMNPYWEKNCVFIVLFPDHSQPQIFDRFHFVQRWQINLSFLYTVCGLSTTIVLLLGLRDFVFRFSLQLTKTKTQGENRVGFGTTLQAVTGYDTHTCADQVILPCSDLGHWCVLCTDSHKVVLQAVHAIHVAVRTKEIVVASRTLPYHAMQWFPLAPVTHPRMYNAWKK